MILGVLVLVSIPALCMIGIWEVIKMLYAAHCETKHNDAVRDVYSKFPFQIYYLDACGQKRDLKTNAILTRKKNSVTGEPTLCVGDKPMYRSWELQEKRFKYEAERRHLDCYPMMDCPHRWSSYCMTFVDLKTNEYFQVEHWSKRGDNAGIKRYIDRTGYPLAENDRRHYIPQDEYEKYCKIWDDARLLRWRVDEWGQTMFPTPQTVRYI